MSVYSSFNLRYEVHNDQDEELNGIVTKLTELVEQGETLKSDRATSVTRVRFHNRDLIVKQFTARSVWHSIKRVMRRSRANNAWNASAAFTEAGIAVPAALMYMERRIGLLRFDSFFVYQAIDGDSLLEVLPSVGRIEQAALIEQLASLFSKLRANHLVHGDMKATNLLVVGGQVVIIDLDVAGRCKHLFSRAHARDQKRFLKNWIGNESLSEELCEQINTP
jgi:tRNA A-37 threonylcarbamoyl transferase component Bud32